MDYDTPDAPPWLPMGSHGYRVEGDTVIVRTAGNATLESTIIYMDLLKQLIARHGYALTVVDLTHSGLATPEARRYLVQAIREIPSECIEVVAYGTNRLVSTFVQLTTRAVSLLTGRDASVSFVRDEAAALRWRDERRSALQSRLAKDRAT